MNLYEHQKTALDETKDFNRVAYYLDMGLGKTFVGSEKADSFPNKIMVVCQKSKIEDWIEHFRTYYNYTVFDLTDKVQLEEFMVTIGKCVGVINYDLIFRRNEILNLTDITLMLDESSVITNPSAKRTKFILKMKPANVILLSGTPTGGKYEKLWTQLHLLGWSITKKTFYQHYIIQEWIEDNDSGFKIPIIVGYKNVDRLKHKLKQHGCIFMKTENVFDLPEMVDVPVMVDATREYRRFMLHDIVSVDNVELIGDTRLTKRMYARQLCGSYNKAKLAAFKDLAESTDDRLIVFYNFNDELFKLIEIAQNLDKPISIVNGDTKDLDAYENFDNSITFLQYQAGAMGLNLQKANKIIYFTLPQSSDLFEQSKKRVHRIGQSNNCFYYYLMCRNSIEESILSVLKMRKDYDDDLFTEYERNYR